MNANDVILTGVETINAFDITTGAYMFTLDEIQSASIAQTEEKVDITGKRGRKLSTLKRNKAVTISGTNGIVSGGLLELQTGGTFASKATKVLWTDYLTIQSNGATTTYKAVGTSGAEIDALYVKDANGFLGTKLTQDTTAASGKFAYDPSTKALTFSGLSNGTEIVVFYKRNITATVLENASNNYSKKCKLYVDGIGEDACGNQYHVQFYIPKADFNGEFTLDIGEDQTVHNFEADCLAGACGTAGQLWTYTIFANTTADTAVA